MATITERISQMKRTTLAYLGFLPQVGGIYRVKGLPHHSMQVVEIEEDGCIKYRFHCIQSSLHRRIITMSPESWVFHKPIRIN